MVTRAASGIGQATAQRLAEEGARVAVAYLASANAAFITGQTLGGNGGLTMI
jgi:NAD(P)-dependent dehydrogenase (short-subunit alcohol dehydrogenase family)